MRNSLTALGFSHNPRSGNTISHLVMEHGRKVRCLHFAEIQTRKTAGDRFSSIFDEWTSTRNRRYTIVNLHGRETFWSLGLVRDAGSMLAEKCIELLDKKFCEFGLNMTDDIVGITTDGA